jgi:hypothetical protein
MEKSKTNKSNPHAWFWAWIENLPGYDERYKKEIAQGTIYGYSGERTSSLSELYNIWPDIYEKMKIEALKYLREKRVTDQDQLIKARRRLIACLFDYLKKLIHDPTIVTMGYVMSVASKAAKVNYFNDIDLDNLQYLYRIFGTKNAKLTKKEQEVKDEIDRSL